MNREKLIKKLERLLEKQKKEIHPHRMDGAIIPMWECTILVNAINSLKEII